MMHLSDSGGLAEGDFDYKPDLFSLESRKELQDFMSNRDFTENFGKKNPLSLLVGSVEKLLESRRYGEQHWCQCVSSFGNGECRASRPLGTRGFLAQKQNDCCKKSLTGATRASVQCAK